MPEPTEGSTPTGAAAVRAAANGDPSPAAAAAALAYFMGDEEPPGSDDVLHLEVEMKAGQPKVRYTFRSLGIEELDKCAQQAADAIRKGDVGDLGAGFVRWSYVFAMACIDPDLAHALAARRQREKDPDVLKQLGDTAGLVRLVFRKRAGILQQASYEIERAAKLGEAGDAVSVVEVEAGKP